jgi:hypothetical protein
MKNDFWCNSRHAKFHMYQSQTVKRSRCVRWIIVYKNKLIQERSENTTEHAGLWFKNRSAVYPTFYDYNYGTMYNFDSETFFPVSSGYNLNFSMELHQFCHFVALICRHQHRYHCSSAETEPTLFYLSVYHVSSGCRLYRLLQRYWRLSRAAKVHWKYMYLLIHCVSCDFFYQKLDSICQPVCWSIYT